jgi:hypothetical protein
MSCADGTSNIVIQLNPYQGRGCHDGPARRQLHVEVLDIRKDKKMEKTTLGDISLGKIDLYPPEAELIKAIVENTLCDISTDGTSLTDMPTVYCGINTFDILTPATPLYWDVIAKIELVLRVEGQDYTISGAANEQTWIWPSRDIIHRVVNKALQKVIVELKQKLTFLFQSNDHGVVPQSAPPECIRM